jgi:crotonobetainyl-CoA:carnitine CoA-transferase CaiB-like acyl-CoA transferase
MYRTADGAMVAVACENESHWRALAKCVGRPELAYAGDWAAANAAPYNGRLGRVLETLFQEDAADVWLRRLQAHGVPARIAARAKANPRRLGNERVPD